MTSERFFMYGGFTSLLGLAGLMLNLIFVMQFNDIIFVHFCLEWCLFGVFMTIILNLTGTYTQYLENNELRKKFGYEA